MAIYVKGAGGSRKKVAGIGLPGPAGKSAYQYAVDGGFTGTEEQFAELQMGRSNLNLLDNWYFPDPVNQRGQMEYTANGYTIDRWMIFGDGVHTLTVDETGCVFTGSGTDNIYQKLEKNIVNGRTVTLSVLLKNVTGSVKLRFRRSNWNFFKEINCVDGLNSLTVTVPEENDNYMVTLSTVDENPTAFGFAITAAKLEFGTQQTLAHQDEDGNWVLNDPPPNRALELAKCQRYFFRMHACRLRMSAVNGKYIYFAISMPCMRTRPSIKCVANDDNVHWIRSTKNVGLIKLSELTYTFIYAANDTNGCISFEKENHGVEDCELYIGGYIDFSSDL